MVNPKNKNRKYKLAAIFRCIDFGRDRIVTRLTQPFLFAITFSTWLKVYFPNFALTRGIFFIILLGISFIIFYFISGYILQRSKLLHEEQKFDILRNPIMMEMYNDIKEIKEKLKIGK